MSCYHHFADDQSEIEVTQAKLTQPVGARCEPWQTDRIPELACPRSRVGSEVAGQGGG